MSLPLGLKTNVTARLPTDYKKQPVDHIVISMPLPPRALSPNSRPHWAAKAKAVAAYREEAYYRTMAAMRQADIASPWPAASVEPHFYFATRRLRDTDNLAASLKSARDGIADAGLVANDSQFTNVEPVVHVVKNGPNNVELRITKGKK